MTIPVHSIIDFHSHHIPSEWTPLLPPNLLAEQRTRWEGINHLIADPAAVLAAVEEGDIAGRVLNIPSALFTPPGALVTVDTFRKINDRIAEISARAPESLHGLASVDAFGGDEAAAELVRAIRDLGLRGVFVESARGDLLLDAAVARPVLAAAAELRIPVFVHPVNPQPLTQQLSRYPQTGILFARGAINAASLIALIESGRLDEFPDLPIVVTTLAIGGLLLEGTFNDKAFRHDDGAGVLRRQVYVDTMGFNPILIRATADLLGSDHILAGSDWPIVNHGPIRQQLKDALDKAGIDESGQAQIAWGNAARLLRLTS